jgi:hypothetical protein
MAVSADPNGSWDGEVRIVGKQFRSLQVHANAEVGSSTVPVMLQEGRLFVGLADRRQRHRSCDVPRFLMAHSAVRRIFSHD